MKASKHEQELIDYINDRMFPLYAEYDKAYGVTIYPSAGKLALDHSWDTFDNWLRLRLRSAPSLDTGSFRSLKEARKIVHIVTGRRNSWICTAA